MKTFLLAALCAAAVTLIAPAPAMAQGIEIGPGGVRIYPDGRRRPQIYREDLSESYRRAERRCRRLVRDGEYDTRRECMRAHGF